MNFALCRNSDLIEELGQVEFVFSDKTGTLTQNKMEFKKCHVGKQVYGNPETDTLEWQGMINSSVTAIRNALSWQSKVVKAENDRRFALQFASMNAPENGDDAEAIYNFFRALAVCHTVVVDNDPVTGEIIYQASSPDELALINGASQVGLILQSKSQTSMTIQNDLSGHNEIYEILAEFPFDSDRKRMTLVVRSSEGKVFLLCKGADSIILDRLKKEEKQSKYTF